MILKKISESGKQGFHNNELTDNHWALVRMGYLKNLVSFGVHPWIFTTTGDGENYIKTLQERDK